MILETILLRPAPWQGPRPLLFVLGALVLVSWTVMLAHGWGWPAVTSAHASAPGPELAAWLAMVLAAMLPLTYGNLRYTAFASFKERRTAACLWFLLGYLLPWLVLGMFVAGLRPAIADAPIVALLVVLALSVAWFPVLARRKAVAAAHRELPLAPRGWSAVRDAVRFGALIGRGSLLSCGALMVACALSGHNVLLLVGSTMLLTVEHAVHPRHRREMLAALVTLVVVFVLLLLFGPAMPGSPHA